jgi:hypothetical protein
MVAERLAIAIECPPVPANSSNNEAVCCGAQCRDRPGSEAKLRHSAPWADHTGRRGFGLRSSSPAKAGDPVITQRCGRFAAHDVHQAIPKRTNKEHSGKILGNIATRCAPNALP